MQSQRVGHNWATFTFTIIDWQLEMSKWKYAFQPSKSLHLHENHCSLHLYNQRTTPWKKFLKRGILWSNILEKHDLWNPPLCTFQCTSINVDTPTQWTWVWANSGRQWRTEEPGVLQSMELQRVGHDLVNEQQQQQQQMCFPEFCEPL